MSKKKKSLQNDSPIPPDDIGTSVDWGKSFGQIVVRELAWLIGGAAALVVGLAINEAVKSTINLSRHMKSFKTLNLIKWLYAGIVFVIFIVVIVLVSFGVKYYTGEILH
jgi:hypothetical protein